MISLPYPGISAQGNAAQKLRTDPLTVGGLSDLRHLQEIGEAAGHTLFENSVLVPFFPVRIIAGSTDEYGADFLAILIGGEIGISGQSAGLFRP